MHITIVDFLLRNAVIHIGYSVSSARSFYPLFFRIVLLVLQETSSSFAKDTTGVHNVNVSVHSTESKSDAPDRRLQHTESNV